MNETPRTIVSLLLFIHCFCLSAVLSANFAPSALQQQLVSFAAPYTRLLNFDPNFARFHLTHGDQDDDDHFIEVAAADGPRDPIARLPELRWPGGERYHRQQRLASAMAFYARRDVDSATAELARSLGAHYIDRHDFARVVIRCRQHRAQPMNPFAAPEATRNDPFDPFYFETVYEADVWKTDDGTIQVLKRSSRREVAPPVGRGLP